MTRDPLTSDDFLVLVETDLRLRHVPFDLAELRAFVEDAWPLVEPGDTPETWATTFLQATPHRAGV
jgi:hypothetical protein